VGRGTLAGPVVAAAVILPKHYSFDGLNDSKKISEKKRNHLSKQILKQALSWSIAYSDVNEIDNMNILRATMLAMRRSILGLSYLPDLVRIDGNTLPNLNFHNELINGEAIIGGDGKVDQISAASIIAKVYRDKLMTNLDSLFPGYNFAKHKGYGTKDHLERIKYSGPCSQHRMSFKPLCENMTLDKN
jgi:ribonuclease HII